MIAALIKKYGPISPVAEYLAKSKGTWRGVPTAVGSQVKPCCSRFDLYKEHAGIDLRDMFPADESKYDKAKTDNGPGISMSTAAQKLHKAGFPVGLPMGQTTDAVDWVGAFVQRLWRGDDRRQGQHQDQLRRDPAGDGSRPKIMEASPPEVFAWDDAGNNRWLISGKGSGIMNPPSAWAVAKRDNPKVAEQCWTHPVPRGPKGRFVGQLPQFYGLWKFSKNKAGGERSPAAHLAEGIGRPTGRSLGRLRSAVLQDHV